MSVPGNGVRVVRRHPEAPASIRWIVRRLEEAGHETWAVGGAVRDVLLGVESVDWDLATRARPGQVRRIFRRTVPLGIEHGTVGVLTRSGTMVEVTTFRRDVETFGRHATVEFADTVDEDLARRDFTINAVAWHPLRDELHDPFDGVGDLRRGLLRTVGDPRRRFGEDYLRVLRALRFAGRFDLRIEPSTWSALVAAVAHLDILSPERIREELLKVLEKDAAPSGALSLWAASGALKAVAPELWALVERGVGVAGGVRRGARGAAPPADAEPPATSRHAGAELDPWAASCLAVDVLPRRRPLVRLSALLAGVGGAADGDPADGGPAHEAKGGGGRAERGRRRAAQLLTRLRFSNAAADRVAGTVAAGPEPPRLAGGPERRRWLARTGPGRLHDLVRVWGARARVAQAVGGRGAGAPDRVARAVRSLRAELRSGAPLEVGDLALDGRDLIRLGLRPGPMFGEILDALLDRVLDDPGLNRKETLLRIVEERWLAGGSPGPPAGGGREA